MKDDPIFLFNDPSDRCLSQMILHGPLTGDLECSSARAQRFADAGPPRHRSR